MDKVIVAVCLLVTPVVPVSAGTIVSSVTTYPSGIAIPNVSVKLTQPDGQSLDIVVVQPMKWTLAFRDSSTVMASVALSTDSPAEFMAYSYSIVVPYYRAAMPQHLYAPVVQISPGDSEAAKFAAFASKRLTSKDKEEVFRLHQLARAFYIGRDSVHSGAGVPRLYDVSIAYDLLVTARSLLEKSYVIPDPETLAAADWLERLRDESPEKFNSRSVSVDEADDAVERVRNWQRMIYENIQRDVDTLLQSSKDEDKAHGCLVAISFYKELSQIDDDQADVLDPESQLRSQSAANAANCTAKKGLSGNAPTADDVALSKSVISDSDKWNSDPAAKVSKNAANRIGELKAVTKLPGWNQHF